jgi:hypothetical protein
MIIKEKDVLYLDGKLIGKMEGNILYMKRNVSKHFYRVLDSWCLNIEVVNSGAERFVIDTEQRERFIIRLSAVKALRSKINMFVTFGQERQLAIPSKCWDRYSHENLSFPAFIGMPPTEFVDNCSGRWRSRLIANEQTEIAISV